MESFTGLRLERFVRLLRAVRDRRVGASSRVYRFSANVQVVVDAETRLVIAAARPVPGTTADAHAWRASGLAAYCQGVTVLGEGAYLNCGMAVPHRKRHRRPLPAGEEADNAAHRKIRARVEHVIGRMKNYKQGLPAIGLQRDRSAVGCRRNQWPIRRGWGCAGGDAEHCVTDAVALETAGTEDLPGLHTGEDVLDTGADLHV
ncbi:hypothetical protein ACVWXU_001962 [Streptomyces sp. TE33382]